MKSTSQGVVMYFTLETNKLPTYPPERKPIVNLALGRASLHDHLEAKTLLGAIIVIIPKERLLPSTLTFSPSYKPSHGNPPQVAVCLFVYFPQHIN